MSVRGNYGPQQLPPVLKKQIHKGFRHRPSRCASINARASHESKVFEIGSLGSVHKVYHTINRDHHPMHPCMEHTQSALARLSKRVTEYECNRGDVNEREGF